MISIASPILGAEEEEAILHVLRSGQLAQGEYVARFEQQFAEVCRVKEAIAVSSGTAALHLALLAHDIGPGDEVITTAFSFSATATAILLAGATPVFVDIEPDTYNIDPVAVAEALTERTKAILPVHLYGNPCAMLQLEQIAQTHHLLIIEDACQAHAARVDGRSVGSFGTGCFSFYATKNMTTGEGGMVTTNDQVIAERVRLLRNHGQQERYHHVSLGYNLRMTEIQAALGLVQLKKLEQFTERRIAHAHFFTEHLSKYVQTPVVRPQYRHVYHQYTIGVPHSREEWVMRLREKGIGTAIHYPVPIYRQPAYQKITSQFHIYSQGREGSENDDLSEPYLPVTEMAAQHVLSLPVHPALREKDLTKIVREIIALCQ